MKLSRLFMPALCLSLWGCQATVNTVENRDRTMRPNSIDTLKVSTDSFVKDRLVVKRVDTAKQADGLLKVQVTAVNTRTSWCSQICSWVTGDAPYQIIYRFTWLDKNGIKVNTASQTWIPMEVIPGDTVRISSISPNANCQDFVLSVREDPNERR